MSNVILIWRPEGSIFTAQVILTVGISYAVEKLPSGRQMSMTFFLTLHLSLHS